MSSPTYIHACIYSYIRTYIHAYIHSDRQTDRQTYLPTYIHTYIHFFCLIPDGRYVWMKSQAKGYECAAVPSRSDGTILKQMSEKELLSDLTEEIKGL